MFKNTSKFYLTISFLTILNSYLQAYNHWGERHVLSLLFFILGTILLILSIIGVIVLKKNRKPLVEQNE
ncbi:hypothetical protein MHI39_19340 [Heyndrickxia sp. FSL K6-6286]|uniref:hypothetical protein n=1 Tax=Heyndrickxia sp. FSL K6-6286 TaxID=2921510 RepID=UPI003159E295